MMIGNSMVQPQMVQDWFRNVSNLDLVEASLIRDLIYACNALDCYILTF